MIRANSFTYWVDIDEHSIANTSNMGPVAVPVLCVCMSVCIRCIHAGILFRCSFWNQVTKCPAQSVPALSVPARPWKYHPCSRSSLHASLVRCELRPSFPFERVLGGAGQYRYAMLPRSAAESSRGETAPATGGCMVLSRMSFASKGVVFGTQAPMRYFFEVVPFSKGCKSPHVNVY